MELEVKLFSANLLLLVGHSRTLGHSLLRGLLESLLASWNLVGLEPSQLPVCCWEGRKQLCAGIRDLLGQQRWMLLESHGQGGFVHPQMGWSDC